MSTFTPPLAHWLLSGAGRRRRRRAAVRLIGSWTAFAQVAVPLVRLPLHRNVLHRASIAVPPLGAAPTRECPAQAVDRGARHPRQVLGVEGLAPHRAGISPLRVRRAEPAVGRRCRGGAELAPVRSCSTKRPRRRCTPAWGRGVEWFVPSESS
jgi:hypothetical protein